MRCWNGSELPGRADFDVHGVAGVEKERVGTLEPPLNVRHRKARRTLQLSTAGRLHRNRKHHVVILPVKAEYAGNFHL